MLEFLRYANLLTAFVSLVLVGMTLLDVHKRARSLPKSEAGRYLLWVYAGVFVMSIAVFLLYVVITFRLATAIEINTLSMLRTITQNIAMIMLSSVYFIKTK